MQAIYYGNIKIGQDTLSFPAMPKNFSICWHGRLLFLWFAYCI